jgi:hypothetical protein
MKIEIRIYGTGDNIITHVTDDVTFERVNVDDVDTINALSALRNGADEQTIGGGSAPRVVIRRM